MSATRPTGSQSGFISPDVKDSPMYCVYRSHKVALSVNIVQSLTGNARRTGQAEKTSPLPGSRFHRGRPYTEPAMLRLGYRRASAQRVMFLLFKFNEKQPPSRLQDAPSNERLALFPSASVMNRWLALTCERVPANLA